MIFGTGKFRNCSLLVLVLSGIPAAWASPEAEAPRVMLMESRPVAAPEAEPAAREIGRIAGAVRIAVPEMGTHIVVLTQVGEVWTWGDNTWGQRGAGHREPLPGWFRVPQFSDAVAIAAGAQHTVVLRGDGSVWTWGENAQGQLGDGTLLPNLEPRSVAGLQDIVSVAAGALFTAVLKVDGSLWVFGSNWGDIAPGAPEKMLTRPVRASQWHLPGEISVYAGVIVERPWPVPDEVLERIAPFREPATSLLDLAEGWGVAWVEMAPPPAAPPVPPAIGVPLPYGPDPATTPPAEARPEVDLSPLAQAGIVQVSAGRGHTLAIDGDGWVWAWGENLYGQLGSANFYYAFSRIAVPSTMSGATAVAAGGNHSLALKSDGTVWAWGSNIYGQVGVGSSGNYHRQPAQITALQGKTVIAIAAGDAHSLALTSDGVVWAWGRNNFGQLGDGSTTDRTTPTAIPNFTGLNTIAAGDYHSLAATERVRPVAEG